MTKIAIIYYSATGTNHEMAKAVVEGAEAAGAGEVRRRLVRETAPKSAIDSNPKWRAFVEKTEGEPRAELDDLRWADAVIFGSPTRYGNAASQLRAFIDTTGGLWFSGELADKVYAVFTSAQNRNGGQETTLLTMINSLMHFGGYIVTPGYTSEVVSAAGGNPYGPSATVGEGGPTDEDLAHARYLGERVAKVTARLKG